MSDAPAIEGIEFYRKGRAAFMQTIDTKNAAITELLQEIATLRAEVRDLTARLVDDGGFW